MKIIKQGLSNHYLLLFLIAIFFVVFYSFSTSMLYSYTDNDSPIFMTIGKFWNENLIPYIDLSDHKGPLIFFIDMLGFKFLGSKTGILIIQIISLFVTEIFLYKIASLEVSNKKKVFLFVLLTMMVLPYTYQCGNMTEEYCLPFITACLFFHLKYLKNYKESKKTEHNYWYALFYGISFAACFLTRLTNAISICAGVLIISIILIKNKEWKNLFKNMIFFIIGALLPIAAFGIYFYFQGALYDFFEGTLLYNIHYQSNAIHWWQEEFLLPNLKTFVFKFFPSYILIFISILTFKSKQYEKGFLYLLIGTLETILFASGRLYEHYAMIALPNYLILLVELNNFNLKKWLKNILFSILIIYSIYGSTKIGYHMIKLSQLENNCEKYRQLIAIIPENEKNSFIAYNTDNNIYLYYNIKPYYKYFILQDWHAQNDEETAKEIHRIYKDGNVKWLLFQGDKSKSVIEDILDAKYQNIKSVKINSDLEYTIYRIK